MKSLDEVKSELQCLAEGGCKGVCGECDFNGPVCLLTTISDALDKIRCLERVRAEQASTITCLRDAISKQQKVQSRLLEEISQLELQIPRWIPVEEQLPPDGIADYLVTIKQKYPWENEWEYYTDKATYGGSYIDGLWDTEYNWIEGQETHITHWMPLPEPQKENE